MRVRVREGVSSSGSAPSTPVIGIEYGRWPNLGIDVAPPGVPLGALLAVINLPQHASKNYRSPNVCPTTTTLSSSSGPAVGYDTYLEDSPGSVVLHLILSVVRACNRQRGYNQVRPPFTYAFTLFFFAALTSAEVGKNSIRLRLSH